MPAFQMSSQLFDKPWLVRLDHQMIVPCGLSDQLAIHLASCGMLWGDKRTGRNPRELGPEESNPRKHYTAIYLLFMIEKRE